MDPAIAHRIASQSYEGQRNRFGDPVIDHLARVAAAVPADAQATALLHGLFELCPYGVCVRRIAQAPGPAGRLARIVKLADLDDHLAHRTIPSDAPPYAWARKQLLATAKNGVTCRRSVG